jgi:predicted nucleic acid-binding protein
VDTDDHKTQFRNVIFIAEITQVELISGISRRRREEKMSAEVVRWIRLLIDRHVEDQYEIAQLSPSIIKRAGDLLEKYPLRAYDAVQLSSALENHLKLLAADLSELIFVSADQRLLSVAAAEGLQTADPNLHAAYVPVLSTSARSVLSGKTRPVQPVLPHLAALHGLLRVIPECAFVLPVKVKM